MTYPCDRCLGKGKIQAFSHVLGGVCLKCGGSGKQTSKPRAPTLKWAVHLPKTVEHPKGFLGSDRVYIETGKSPAEAAKKARNRFYRTVAVQDECTLEGLWVEPYAEYESRVARDGWGT